MQILIDIPEEIYIDIKEDVRTKVNTFEHIPFLHEVISVGTPLPKGHGDLIDRKGLIEDFKDSKKISFAERMDISCIVDHAQAIIEADAESEE